MRKIFGLIMLSMLALCADVRPAYAEPIVEAPAFFYIVGNDRSKVFDSWEAAYGADQIRLAGEKDPTTGLAHWRGVGAEPVKPSGNSSTI